MNQQEAEEAAAARNREDARRDRFVFYALDESAGISPDAWDVAMRLRRDDERPREARTRRSSTAPPRPRRSSTPPPRSRAPAAAAVIEPGPVAEPEPVAQPEPVAMPEADPALDGGEPTQVYDIALEPEAHDVAAPEPEPRRRRFGLLRLWGVFVVLVGLAFIAAVLIVAFAFRDYTHLSTLTWGTGVAAGLFAVWIGVALARRRR